MNLAELQKEAHAIARDKGWYDTERTFGDFIALIHSELSEALEEFRRGRKEVHGTLVPVGTIQPPDTIIDRTFELLLDHDKPVGVAVELADVVIRVADMAEHYDIELYRWGHVRSFAPITFGDWITVAHMQVDDLVAEWCLRDTRQCDHTARGFGQVVNVVESMAEHYGIDLNAAIKAKMEFNKTRPYRHGGKAL